MVTGFVADYASELEILQAIVKNQHKKQQPPLGQATTV